MLAIALAAIAAAPAAQLPGFPGGKSAPAATTPAPPPAAESAADARARLEKLAAAARAERDRTPSAPPAGITPAEEDARYEAVATLAYAYDGQLRALAEAERLRAARAAAEAAEREWAGFAEPPPYPVARVDALRDAADAARARIAAIESAGAHVDAEADRLQEAARRADEELRRAREAAEIASDGPQRAATAWRADAADWQARSVGARAALARMAADGKREEANARRAELKLLDRQVGAAMRSMRFDESDLAAARKRLDESLEALRRERTTLQRESAERVRERDAASREADAAKTGTPAAEAAQARLRAAQAWVDTLAVEGEALTGVSTLASLASQMWGHRYALFHATDEEARRAALARMREGAAQLTSWRAYIDDAVSGSRSRLRAAETAADEPAGAPALARYRADAAKAAARELAAYERIQARHAEALRVLTRWIGDAEKADAARDWRARLAGAWLDVRDAVRALWNFELFAVEDSSVVDGKAVTVERGVTVGKSVGALLLFVIGYWLAARLVRFVERRAVAAGRDAARAKTIRRWALAVVAVGLLLLTLNVVRIPITVFAFLGGALAIGVGFGTQTIIRNFISGMILLMERRVQVGDTIEIDGVTGTVTSVDLRSTTVAGADGLETIVPNSMLLEHKVTNWTLTSRSVRRSVSVGVAYGTPMRQAAELIEATAKRHGNVLADPAPFVVFEDFGDSAQVLTLYFWVELRPQVSALRVASDLRFMLEKQLAEAGISIAFPQRELRVDTSRALRVEVAAAPSGKPPEAP
ncbi:MAG: mechanosensitive ion channel [Burkholderiales bacterium]